MSSLFREITAAPSDVPVRRMTVTINGETATVDVEPRLLLAHLIRQGFKLTGTHTGCDTTNCGACTVLLDGEPVKSCTVFAVQADGREVMTVEGLAGQSSLHPIQEGFKDEHGLQCGFCTPGDDDGIQGAARSQFGSDRGRGAVGALGQPVPMHRISEHRKGRPVGGREAPSPGRDGGGGLMTLDEIKIGGLGSSRRRVEDDRFIRGKGNYVDDIVLPGMLHMEILRSPLAHARIKSIDVSKAWEMPGVRLVLTGEMMAARNLAWMPTLSYDTQAVLATDKVRFQGQEVACVVADDPYIAKDACEAIIVEYEPLPAIVNPEQALAPNASVIRDDKENQLDNVIFDWEVGDKTGTDAAFAEADVVSKLELHYPRSHPSPIETCGSIADFDRATSKLTVYMTSQAPHIIRAAVALVAELPEHMIRIVSPDIGGGFGNKVPVYPGYVASILASILLERPVKWIEDKSGNLISTGFARDVYLKGEMAVRRDGRILGVRMFTHSDHGAFFSDAQPSKFKIGLMHSAFACYDIPAAHLTAQGVYTNKAPGGVAYRCSFRVTEAMFFQERMVQAAADDLGMDQAEFRRINFVKDDDFPHRTAFGFLTDSGQYAKCLDIGLEAIGYEDFLKEKEEANKRGRLLGIGISTMTEPLGAGNSREYDILGIKMFDSAELRIHMTGKAILRTGAKSQGQGHETTWAQIVAHELGIPAEDIVVEEGDTDTAPFGMGTYASRSTPVAGAAVAMVARKIRAQGAQAGCPPPRGLGGGHRVGTRTLLPAGQPGAGCEHPGMRHGRLLEHA